MKLFSFLLITIILLNGCNALKHEKVDNRKRPTSGIERARQNVNEGKGVSVKSLLGGGGGDFQFSSSNPMWRASLETLDFIPMTTVDYSGGIIISDWYSNDNNSSEALKISIRFLSNEIRSDSIKIIVHKKDCSINQNCTVSLIENSSIKNELRSTILTKASLLEKQSKKSE